METPLNSNGLTYMFIKSSVTVKVNHKWEEFGTALGLSPLQIQEIKENNISEGNYTAFCDVVMVWQTEKPKLFTWQTLFEVLESDHVAEYELALELKEKVLNDSQGYHEAYC